MNSRIFAFSSGLSFVTAALALLAPTSAFAALAAAPAPCAVVGTPFVTLTQRITNDPDSGNFGNWATDAFTEKVSVWVGTDGASYCANASTTDGTFTTLAGGSPEKNAPLSAGFTGTFTGGENYLFSSSSPLALSAAYSTTSPQVVMLPDSSTAGFSWWVNQVFPAVASSTGSSYVQTYSLTYVTPNNGTWTDADPASGGDTGDITNALQNVYVDATNGSDSGDGSQATPVKTIAEGLSKAASGGTVHVASGVYAESPVITAPVTLEASGTATSTISGQVTVNSANVTVSGFEITNPSGTFGVLVNQVGGVSVSHNDIHDIGTSQTAANVYGIYFQSSHSSTTTIAGLSFENNTITNTGTTTDAMSNGAIGVGDSKSLQNVTGLTISGNTVSGVYAKGKGAYGILLNLGGPGGTHADTASVIGATITGNDISSLVGGWEHAIGLETDTPNATVSGNTVHNLGTAADVEAVHMEVNPDAGTVAMTNNTRDGVAIVGGTASVLVDSAAPEISSLTTEPNTYFEALVGGTYRYIGLNVFPKIQEGVSAVASGGTVTVDAGTYPESVLINKAISLVGASGATLTGTSTADYIVEVSGAANGATLDGLTIDGGGSNASPTVFGYGIWVTNSGSQSNPVEIKNSTVKDVWAYIGGSDNAGIEVDGGSYALIHDDTVSSFEKRGVRFTNASGKLYDSEVIGDNVDGTSRVQNLVNLWGGSNVEIFGNKLHNALTTGGTPTWDSPAIFVSSYGGNGASTADIHDNQIYSDDTGVTLGSFYATTDTSSATIADNTFHDLNWAINLEKGTVTAAVHGNSFGANVSKAVNSNDGNGGPSPVASVDAVQNWWGSATGPTAASNSGGTGGAVYSGVSYAPWYADAGMTTLDFGTPNISGGAASTTVSVPLTLTGTSTQSGSSSVTASIPSGTTVTSDDSSWDGTLDAPTATTTTVVVPGYDTTVSSAIAVGSSASDLTFDNAAELLFAGQAGKLVGWFDHTGGNFTQIQNCSAFGSPAYDQAWANQNLVEGLTASSSCAFDSGSDLVVWTKHFSTYATYTTSLTAPTISPSGSVFHGPVTITMDDAGNGTSIRYTTDGTDPTCSSGSGYGGAFTLVTSTTLKALRCGPGNTDSAVVTDALDLLAAVDVGGTGGGSTGGGAISVASPAPVAAPAVPAGQVLGAAAYHFAASLSVGSAGSDVTALQQFLIGGGFPIPAGATGYFGSETKAAVVAYQKANALPATGYVGPLTLALLNEGTIPTVPESAPLHTGTALTAAQAGAIINLLQAFGADASVIAKVKVSLGQ